MALRVLLADESSTIKKAIQLVLSEYGVEVKTVPTGIDVLSVTRTFMPDVVIADILLNKKNGYEVCIELKNNVETRNIPVILMWSSFMQLDEQLFRDSKADASLEKPFEAETIKSIFEKLVPKLQTFPLRGMLRHPPLPDFEESDTFVKLKNTFTTLVSNDKPNDSGTVVFDEPVDFDIPSNDQEQGAKLSFKQKLAQKNQLLHKTPEVIKPPVVQKPTPAEQKPPERDEWSPSKANQFVIETENFGDFEEVKVVNTAGKAPFDLKEQVRNYIKDSPMASHKSENSRPRENTISNFDEQLIKEEIRQIAERVAWQVIPEIAEKIIREELAKLLQGIEKNI